MLEAMAAALPIVASRTSAHASIIDDGITGLLCDSATTYGDALKHLEDVNANERLGGAARDWARCKIGTWDDCAQRYFRVYTKLLGNDRIE